MENIQKRLFILDPHNQQTNIVSFEVFDIRHKYKVSYSLFVPPTPPQFQPKFQIMNFYKSYPIISSN